MFVAVGEVMELESEDWDAEEYERQLDRFFAQYV